MDNQHKLIAGYRDLSKEEIELINEAKALAELVGEFVDRLNRSDVYGDQPDDDRGKYIDLRFLSIARTQLQLGFMSLTRAVARPETF